MQQPITVRSDFAMRVANFDRQKFNQAVHDGFYPCAPETVAGSVRLFGEWDLVTLFVFARLQDQLGLSPRRAGHLACELHKALQTTDGAGAAPDRLVYVRGTESDCFAPDRYNPDHNYGVGSVILTVDFHIDTIRRLVRTGVAAAEIAGSLAVQESGTDSAAVAGALNDRASALRARTTDVEFLRRRRIGEGDRAPAGPGAEGRMRLKDAIFSICPA